MNHAMSNTPIQGAENERSTKNPVSSPCSTSWQSTQNTLPTLTSAGTCYLLTLPLPLLHPLVLLTHLLALPTTSLDDRRIAIVAIDPHQITAHTIHTHILHDDMSRSGVIGAVAARAIQLTGGDDRVVADGDGAGEAVVLDDSVRGGLCAAAGDESVAGAED